MVGVVRIWQLVKVNNNIYLVIHLWEYIFDIEELQNKMSAVQYGKKTPTTGTPSVYSHVTNRSSANLRVSRSLKSLKVPWYQQPLVQDAIFLDVQRASLVTGIFSLVIYIKIYEWLCIICNIFCSYYQYLRLLAHALTYIAMQWQLQDQHTMVIM